jgi:uncharacterized protein YndB with AHSA1/START domain
MAEISNEINIKAAPDRVYRALTEINGLKSWHTGQVEGTADIGGVLQFASRGQPKFGWEVLASEPTKRVAWKCVQGPGDSVGTTVGFDISPASDSRTLLVCTHGGWPGTNGNYRKCNTLWGVLLHHLRQYVETGKSMPCFE